MNFRLLEEGRPVLIPAEGFPFVHLVHVQDVASMMASLCGNTTVIGEAYNVAGAELTSVEGSIRLMARAVGVEPDIVHVPMELARRARPPLLHWGEAIVGGATFSIDKALRATAWKPAYTHAPGPRDPYEWFDPTS